MVHSQIQSYVTNNQSRDNQSTDSLYQYKGPYLIIAAFVNKGVGTTFTDLVVAPALKVRYAVICGVVKHTLSCPHIVPWGTYRHHVPVESVLQSALCKCALVSTVCKCALVSTVCKYALVSTT